MRVIVDPNVYVSYLLAPRRGRVPAIIVGAIIDRSFDTLVPKRTLEQMKNRIESKAYLAARVSNEQVDTWISLMLERTSVISDLVMPPPRICRDPKDDYLFAHAMFEQVDYLVSGDKDLLVLDGMMGLRIVSPGDFVRILESGP